LVNVTVSQENLTGGIFECRKYWRKKYWLSRVATSTNELSNNNFFGKIPFDFSFENVGRKNIGDQASAKLFRSNIPPVKFS